jgi:hypothetical protein
MDLIPLRGCYLTQEQLTQIVISIGNRQDRKQKGNIWRLIWGSPPRYKFQNRPLNAKIMSSDDPQQIASYVSEQVVLFRKDIEKYILSVDKEIPSNITLSIILQISRGPRSEACSTFNYPLSGQGGIGRP